MEMIKHYKIRIESFTGLYKTNPFQIKSETTMNLFIPTKNHDREVLL
jgi:hypothetical protein